jgi:hypothetical protein
MQFHLKGKPQTFHSTCLYEAYRSPESMNTKYKLILYNFRPNEEVRLLCYSNNSFDDKWIFSLDAWSEFQVQSDGQLILE